MWCVYNVSNIYLISVSIETRLKIAETWCFCSAVSQVAALWMFGNQSDKKVEGLSVIREEGSKNSLFMLPVILRVEEIILEPQGLT